jgi:hypothetical protein
MENNIKNIFENRQVFETFCVDKKAFDNVLPYLLSVNSKESFMNVIYRYYSLINYYFIQKYKYAGNFHDGYAIVMQGKKYGYMNQDGNLS